MSFILGKKLKMDQIWDDEDKVVPVTVIQAGPIKITQIRTIGKDRYEAVQAGFDSSKKKINKPLKGHLKDLGNFRYIREFKIKSDLLKELKIGDVLDVSQFNMGDKIKISSISKAKGFQGVVKRHGFRGGPKTHGQKNRLRAPGSLGATAPQRVMPNKKLAGRMGGERIAVKNLKVIRVDKENNILMVKGAVPGIKGVLLEISG